MAKILVCYYSRTQHTEHMAQAVVRGATQVEGVEVDLKQVGQVKAADWLDYDALIVGSPTYYGTMAAELKALFDESVAFHGKMEGKVGAAFASSANIGGGNETTILDILNAMLIHGMVIQGSSQGGHYGPVAIGDMDARAREECVNLGRRVATLALKLAGPK